MKVADTHPESYTVLDDLKDYMSDKGQNKEQNSLRASRNDADNSDFVLEKVIFSNVFEKDIRRVYLYKKAERLAKAIYLIVPAFADSPSFKDRLDRIAVGLVDAAVLPPAASREALSRELLALSSMLGIARTGGKLTPMNADLIAREAHLLLGEVAGYEEPRLTLEEVPTLASLAKAAATGESARLRSVARVSYDPALDTQEEPMFYKGQTKGHIKDIAVSRPKSSNAASQRREGILSVLKTKGPSYIKDISLVVRDVSEKTIQRELSVLVSEGVVKRKGDRRWTTYELA